MWHRLWLGSASRRAFARTQLGERVPPNPLPVLRRTVATLSHNKKREVWRDPSLQRSARLASLAQRTTALIALAITATPAHAQYWVYDPYAVTQLIQQVQQSAQQLQTMEQQLTQAQQLYGSLNKLTNMADVATLLNSPSIRQALPPNFASVEGLLTGNGTGSAGASQQQFASANSVYQTPGNDFYAGELKAHANQTAGFQSLGQQMFDAASQRITGIDQLRQQISSSGDPKSTLDLQARLQAEIGFAQSDALRMQALASVQTAQIEVTRQRAEENWRQRLDQITGP